MEGDAQSSPAGEGSADACTSDVYGKESTDRAEGLQAGGSPRDKVGLHMFEEIKNGLVTKMSWAFRVSEDSYDRDTRTRTILKIAKVYDVSAVSIPANADTDISARSYFDGVIEREQQERLERRKKLLKIKLMTEV